jgi:hypothetical protein
MKDLGYANSWPCNDEGKVKKPEIVDRCEKMDHVIEGETVGNCLVERWCPICNYSFRIDSSG